MRAINASALAELNKEFGLEAVNIVRVYWNDTPVDYSDKKEGLEQFGVQGKILEISGLDNVISVDRSSNSASIQIKLDDSDGSLRSIINNQDIHKRPVQILQWFTGRPFSDAFVLFTGQINTPMEWSEGERSLSFSVVNQVENLELGFSLEEGIFQQIPVTAFGKGFPLVFGTVAKVPSLMLSESPSGILAEGFAWVFDAVYQAEQDQISSKANDAFKLAEDLYAQSIGLEILAASYNDGDIGVSNGNPDNYETYKQYHQASLQAYQQYLQYSDEYRNLQNQAAAVAKDMREKKVYAKRTVRIATQNFPIGIPVVVEIGNSRFNAVFNGVAMSILGYIEPTTPPPRRDFFAKIVETDIKKTFNTEKSKEKFRWHDAGSKIRVISVPLYYVACFGAGSQILGVFAKKNGVRVLVPNSLYVIERRPFVNGVGRVLAATIIRMNQALTTLYDLNAEQLYDGDEIWCDIQGEVPGNFITIMQWTIALFTTLSADPVTFGLVASQGVINNPMNFAVLDRKNVIDFMKELSLQARCACWIDDGYVKLRYLPVPPTPAVTISPDDVLEDSLIVTCDETERLITKIIADWRPSLDQQDPNKLIIRTNVAKYGLKEETIDYYAYQFAELVQRSATYWSIIWGNTWKRLKFKTHIGKLQLESQDAVLLTGFNSMFCYGDVVGIVESANFDSSSNTIDLEVWLPIRWGEMTQYIFAYPSNVTALYGQGALEFATGNPFAGVTDTSNLMAAVHSTFVGYNAPQYPWGPFHINDTPPNLTFDTAISQGIIYGRPFGLADANNRADFELKTPPPIVIDTKPDDYNMGIVQSALEDGFSYKVKLVGLTTIVTAQQLLIATGFTVVPGTPVYLIKKRSQWYMQAPTWAPEVAPS